MRRIAILAAALLAIAPRAQAQEFVYRSSAMAVHLTQGLCELAEVAVGLAGADALFPARGARVTVNGRELRACWSIDADADVLIGDETGRAGVIPLASFKPAGA